VRTVIGETIGMIGETIRRSAIFGPNLRPAAAVAMTGGRNPAKELHRN
jgi:hypothetical protein